MNHLYPGLGAFEDTLRLDAARLGAHSRHAASPIDLRITRGVGSRGYGMTRVSVLSFGASAASAIDLRSIDARAYNATMKFRWTSSFDLGVVKTSCGAANVYNRTLNLGMGYDADCLNACSADDRCVHYTYFPSEKACEFAADTCEYVAAPLAEATYKTPGRTVYSSAIVNASTNTTFVIGGTAVSLRLPAFGAGARGVVISDPCFSGRWVGCAFGTTWATYNRTISMLNALAAKGDVDYFAFLGDSFYDQDGRLTTALWRHLSLSFKSTLLLTMPGNHDTCVFLFSLPRPLSRRRASQSTSTRCSLTHSHTLSLSLPPSLPPHPPSLQYSWVAGGPPGDQYDQYGWGLNQFYGQDVVSAVALETAGNSTSPRVPLDFSSGGPDKLQHYDAMNNFANNSIFYHIIGNQGFIGFSGAASVDAQRVYFEEACAYMGTADKSLAVVMLLGHVRLLVFLSRLLSRFRASHSTVFSLSLSLSLHLRVVERCVERLHSGV